MTPAEELSLREKLTQNPSPLEELKIRESLVPASQASEAPPREDLPPIGGESSLLPSFLSFDDKESRQKRDLLLKEDPEKFADLMQQSNIEGFNRGVQDIGEGLKQVTLEAGGFLGVSDPQATNDYTKKVSEERERYEETYGLFPGSKVTRFIGESAPYSYLPIKLPSGLAKKYFVGSAIGASVGGTQFVKEGDSRALNMAASATVAVAVPAIGKSLAGIYGWAKELLVDPLTKKGMYKDIATFLQKEIPENRDAIMSAMEASISRGENKTVAQIIAEVTQGSGKNFGGILARLDRDLIKESDVLKTIYDGQTKAKRDILDSIAGVDGDLAAALNQRASTASVNYKNSYGVSIKADAKLAEIGNNKFFKVAYNEAKDIAEVKGINPKDNLTEFLHLTKEGLDKQLNSTDMKGKTTLGREEIKAVRAVKDGLVEWMGKKNVLYDKARKQYIEDSIPVDRMEVGQELKKAFINAVDNESPLAFSKALLNVHKTVKAATGIGRGLEDILEPQEIKGLNAIRKGIIIDVKRNKMASQSKPVLGELTGEMTLSLPHILSRPIVITNHILKSLGQDRTPAYKKMLASMMTDQKKFLEAYRLPFKDPRSQMAVDIVTRMNIIAQAQAAANIQEAVQ